MEIKKKIKANPNIFEKLKSIDVVDMYTLSTTNPSSINYDAEFYYLTSSDAEISRAIPGAFVKNIEEAKSFLKNSLVRIAHYDSILYCIRVKKTNMPVGYICLNSPISQNGLNNWSIDFWLNVEYRGNKVMASSLMQLLGHMQQMEIEMVYAMVEKENDNAIKLITKLGFQFIQHSVGHNNLQDVKDRAIMLYGLKLN